VDLTLRISSKLMRDFFPQLLQNFEFIGFVYDKMKASTG